MRFAQSDMLGIHTIMATTHRVKLYLAANEQQLLLNVEVECKKVGLGLNCPKTKFLAYNNVEVQQPLHTIDGTQLEQKDDFRYLGSWADLRERYRYKESYSLEGNK